MNSTFDFGPEDDRDDGGRDGAGRSIVYIRAVPIAELPDEVREAAGDVTELYALHSAQGERLALVRERGAAFMLARQNDLAPVSVH